MSTAAVAAKPRRVTARAIEGQELVLLAVLAIMWLVLSLAVDTFFTASTLQNLMAAVAPVAIVGVGMTAIIVTAGIDVSVGSAVAVGMVVVGKLVRDSGLDFLPAVLVAVAVGAALGLVNGGLVAYGRVHPIIITFATLNLYRWLAYQIFGGEEVNNIPGTLGVLGGGAEGRTAGLPNAFLLAILLGALLVGTVSAAVTLLGWPSELTALFIGVFILVAVGVDLLRERRRRAL
jgi:ribose transport system permease protein